MKQLLIILSTFILISGTARANVISNDFLSADLGARATAMGSSFGAVANDPTAIFYNAAGLSEQRHFAFLTSYGSVYGMAGRTQLAMALPLAVGSMGFGYVSMKASDLLRTDNAGNVQGSFSYGESAYLASYSFQPGVNWLNLGLTGKYIVKECGDSRLSGLGADISVLVGNDWVKTGLTLQDVNNTPIGNDNYTRQIRLAVSVKPMNDLLLSCDRYADQYSFGAAFNVFSMAQIQAGVGNQGLTLGCSVLVEGININAAYKKHELGDSLMLELGL